MRHYLHGFAQVSTLAFLSNYVVVDLAGSYVVGLRRGNDSGSARNGQVQVGFGAIISYKTFAVLIRI
jgi:hypothetical protein